MLTQHGLDRIEERLSKATPGPWQWKVAGDAWPGPQLEGNIEYEDMNPILITTGCSSGKGAKGEVRGCMPDNYKDDPLKACPLHPSPKDREFIAHSYCDIELLLDYIKDLKRKK